MDDEDADVKIGEFVQVLFSYRVQLNIDLKNPNLNYFAG